MRRRTFILLAGAALSAGCSQDEVVTAQGGGAFEASFATVSPVRTPTMTAGGSGRSTWPPGPGRPSASAWRPRRLREASRGAWRSGRRRL